MRRPTLLHGYDLDTWGFWALAIGGVGAVWAAAVTRLAGPAAAWLVSAAVLVVQPLIVPTVVRDVAGYAWSAGLWAGIAVVVLLLAARTVLRGGGRSRQDIGAGAAG